MRGIGLANTFRVNPLRGVNNAPSKGAAPEMREPDQPIQRSMNAPGHRAQRNGVRHDLVGCR
jgi:hypothetical protein